MILELDPPCNRAGRIEGSSCCYLGADWKVYREPPCGVVFRGPFPSGASLQGLLLAHEVLAGASGSDLSGPAPVLRELCGGRSLFRFGLERFLAERSGELEAPEEPTEMDRLVQGIVQGAFLARRGAVLRLLRGCTVEWGCHELPEPLAWHSPEGELKLLAALLSGLRELIGDGAAPRVSIPGRPTLSTHQIQELLGFV